MEELYKYKQIENRILQMDNIDEIEEITQDLEEEGIVIFDINTLWSDRNLKDLMMEDNISSSDQILVGGVFISQKEKLYLISDLYKHLQNASDRIPTSKYLSVSVLKQHSPLDILLHFFNDKIVVNTTDKKILDKVYSEQMISTYKKILKLTDLIEEKELEIPYETLMKIPFVESKEDVDTYIKFRRLAGKLSKNYLLVSTQTNTNQGAQQIRIRYKNGIPLYQVNKTLGKPGSDFNSYVIPISALGMLLEKTNENGLEVNVTPMDITFNKSTGKLSGVTKDTPLDKDICDFIEINKLYNRGLFTKYEEPIIQDISMSNDSGNDPFMLEW